MNRIIVFLSFFLLLFLQSCVEKEGYYDYGQEKTISLLGVSPTFTTNVTLRLYFHRNIHKLNL